MRHLLTEVKSIKHQMEENQRNLQPFLILRVDVLHYSVLEHFPQNG